MPPVRAEAVPIVDEGGRQRGRMIVRLRPSSSEFQAPAPIACVEREDIDAADCARVQLLEGMEYLYEFVGVPGTVDTDHPEVFDPDSSNGAAGRLRTRLATGTITAFVFSDGEIWGRVEFEVRSRKLGYATEYRWMLRDITETFVEAVILRFSSATHAFEPDVFETASTSYQRFAFLKGILDGGQVEDAIHHVLSRPHIEWTEVAERRPTAQGLRASSAVARELAKAGPRTAWDGGRHLGLDQVPRWMSLRRTEATVDNVPNRFVVYALRHWRRTIAELADAIERGMDSSASRARGLRETSSLLQKLDRWLHHPALAEVNRLRHFPVANQVLEKKAGYRTIYRAYVQAELAAQLTWEGGEDVYAAGKRDVAALYEYWVYLQLAQVVADLCDATLDWGDLVSIDANGLGIGLRGGRQVALRGRVTRGDSVLSVALWFNRLFTTREESWTRPMRPDCSLQIEANVDYDVPLEPTWLHFDAKYRVDVLQELFGGSHDDRPSLDVETRRTKRAGAAKRDDLLKMHAYRDAIRRSAGAYVLFPGDEDEPIQEYSELLPGLGAFALRPSATGEAVGAPAIRRFLNAVCDHYASRLTRHERSRYWQTRVYFDELNRVGARPPADTVALLGFVKSATHLEWIRTQRRYVVRADEGRRGAVSVDSPVLGADLVVLYGHDSDDVEVWRTSQSVEVMDRGHLLRLGYPTPGGELYFVIGLASEFLNARGSWAGVVRSAAGGTGAPVVRAWAAVARQLV